MLRPVIFGFLLCVGLIPAASFAQGAQVAFGVVQENAGLPVEVTADRLSVDQQTGEAIFTGNVVIGQGEMRLSADEVLVFYREEPSGVSRLEAIGNVILVALVGSSRRCRK